MKIIEKEVLEYFNKRGLLIGGRRRDTIYIMQKVFGKNNVHDNLIFLKSRRRKGVSIEDIVFLNKNYVEKQNEFMARQMFNEAKPVLKPNYPGQVIISSYSESNTNNFFKELFEKGVSLTGKEYFELNFKLIEDGKSN